MVKKRNIALIFVLVIQQSFFSQINDSLRTKNIELRELREKISALESELKSKSQKEKESLQVLEKISYQNLLLNKLINKLIHEENSKQKDIELTQLSIDSVNQRINNLQKNYSKYIVWLYKNMGLPFLSYFFNSSSFNQTLIRYKYLNYISAKSKETVDNLKSSKKLLGNLMEKLNKELLEKEAYIAQKQKEQSLLHEKETQRKKIIEMLRNDQSAISSEIADKRKAEIEIKSIIARLIEKERKQKSNFLEKKITNPSYSSYYDYDKLTSFADLKGKLNWPVKSGKIVRKFGENKNERLNTITLNYGIDVNVKGNEEVYAVANGIVSAIDWIPGYGSVLIITHKGEFRTVYGHLIDIKVSEGDEVEAGTLLGEVSDSLEGNILHFEIWNERNFQNPETWLTKK
ncbi:murein hydrolase activator EnvC [Melioribacteraceae bacterium 4301-Me]|uniref:murein hydrolase activator EnvC family protein n=1 Tax=Pyranulibacter aquaticus TaxID=3163344 RepID=UPI00359A5799